MNRNKINNEKYNIISRVVINEIDYEFGIIEKDNNFCLYFAVESGDDGPLYFQDFYVRMFSTLEDAKKRAEEVKEFLEKK